MHTSVVARGLVLAALACDARNTSALRDLPLVEVPGAQPGGNTLAVLLTGDGDWASVDRQLAAELSRRGIALVGFESRSYLRAKRRTPDATARDVARVLQHYLPAWHRERVVLIGYSRGADLLPFVVNRLPADLRQHVARVAMIGLANHASFEFHWVDLLSDTSRPTDLPILPELQRLRGTSMVCVYGVDEEDSLCRSAPARLVKKFTHEGGHRFKGDYRALADVIMAGLAP